MVHDNQNANFDLLFETTASNLKTLHNRANDGDGGRARVLFYALAGDLNQEGIIDALKAAAEYMADHPMEELPTRLGMVQ